MSGPTRGPCSVPGCDRLARRRGWCEAHYMRAWRYGDPTATAPPRWVDLTGRRFGLLEVIERTSEGRWRCRCECGRLTEVTPGSLNARATSSCGDPVHRRSPALSSSGAHARVRGARGPASAQACVDCGSPARQWSYTHDDPAELTQDGMPYSLDPAHYAARCIPCHKRYDLAHLAGRTLTPPPVPPVQDPLPIPGDPEPATIWRPLPAQRSPAAPDG